MNIKDKVRNKILEIIIIIMLIINRNKRGVSRLQMII